MVAPTKLRMIPEVASTFCESVTFEYLLNSLDNDQIKLSLLSRKIEDIFATIPRQIAFYRFEKLTHHQRLKGELKSQTINELWQQELQAMFGKSLTLTDNHQYWWQYVSHFINTPFYVYAYGFGGLISLALYNQYKQTGQIFVEKYKQLLAAGGSDKPENLLKQIGVNIKDKQFWQGGFKHIQKLIDQEIKLAK